MALSVATGPRLAILLLLALGWLRAVTLHAAQSTEPKPEKGSLEVAIAAYGPLYLPLLVAHESGYFTKRGVNLNISQLSATASAQALISGQIDI
jgi:ABC-type nitrate/sulfonate/bicarbonate transport system substrate-binding protein